MLSNKTNFPGISWKLIDSNNDKWYISTVAQTKYKFDSIDENGEWNLIIDDDQGELFKKNIYLDDISKQDKKSVRYESNLCPYKENTDIVLNTFAYSPVISNSSYFNCGIYIIENDQKILENYLEIHSSKEDSNIKEKDLKNEDIYQRVNIRYENTYGGEIKKIDDQGDEKIVSFNSINPIGCGITKIKSKGPSSRNPKISFVNNQNKDYPSGFGFVPKYFKSRLKYIDENGDNISKDEYPEVSTNFDTKYNQGANPDMILNGYIKNNTRFYLDNLLPKKYLKEKTKNIQYFIINTLELYTTLCTKTSSTHKKLNIDTVVIDTLSEDFKKWNVYVSYRSNLELLNDFSSISLNLLNNPSPILGNNHG